MEITDDLPAWDDQNKWINDPRNKMFWNARGKIFRAFPISEKEVVLVDVISGGEIKMSNAEVRFEEKQGNLIEFNPNKPHFFPAGGTGIKKESTGGKYSMGVMKRLLEEGKKVTLQPVEDDGSNDPKYDLPNPKPSAPLAGKYAKKS